MKLALKCNLRTLRKQRGLTQAQLAEAMGVTTGAVSKWEKGQSTPELGLLMELADFFDLSVDALLGFAPRSNDKTTTAERLKTLKREKRLKEGVFEAEKALQRYPNDFRIVYESAELYQVLGIQTKDVDQLKRAVDLLSRACLLIGQNTDENISELMLRINIARTYLAMGQNETGIRLLKQYNPCGVSNSEIGLALSQDEKSLDEAETYLAEALILSINALIATASGFANVFVNRKQPKEATNVLLWLADVLRGLQTSERESYLVKAEATLMLECAHLQLQMGQAKQASASLQTAREAALRFDAAPDYSVPSVRWCKSARPGTAFDNFGETAMEGLLHRLSEKDDLKLTALWKEINHDQN